MLLLLSSALAAPYVLSVSEESALGVGGGWGRVFEDDDDATAWRFLWAAGGDYALLPMTPALTVEDFDRTNLTGRTNLTDHGITRCPDGGFLHAASANVASFNDSAYAFRYDADLALTAEATLAESDPDTPHNDLAVLCSGVVDGVAFAGIGDDPIFIPFGEDGTVGAPIALEDSAQMMGGSLHYEAESDTVLAINFTFDGTLKVARYTTALDLVETLERDASPPGERGYWAQGLLRVGDSYVLAHMARDEDAGFAADEGNVWLTVFDTDWNVLERTQLSQNTPPLGGMRPGIARRDDQILVTYDKEVQPRIFAVRVDLEALGADGSGDTGPDDTDDTGPSDTDDADDTGATDDKGLADGGGCGCASGGDGVGIVGLLGVVALLGRRGSRSALRDGVPPGQGAGSVPRG